MRTRCDGGWLKVEGRLGEGGRNMLGKVARLSMSSDEYSIPWLWTAIICKHGIDEYGVDLASLRN